MLFGEDKLDTTTSLRIKFPDGVEMRVILESRGIEFDLSKYDHELRASAGTTYDMPWEMVREMVETMFRARRKALTAKNEVER